MYAIYIAYIVIPTQAIIKFYHAESFKPQHSKQEGKNGSI